ncbi:lipopolysaccharide transport periplasmic protein LptA [Nevskia soli]|uniref:lipopolysaccharide transport periplasmic protein LptA n=1 Tax=Nevskia soli TaxID=418856 RepID=UPI0004A76866|nr:lipopolysaccharide transport periplasmic protein LptA [Nevskia soli]
MKQRTERILAALALLLPALAWAQDNTAATQVAAAHPATVAASSSTPSKVDQTKDQLTRLPSAADMRPTGPVTIAANRAELTQGNTAVYVGNVTLDSDTLKMDGDRLELKRAADGQYVAKITGSPAHMAHAGNGPDNPPVTAHARTMTYDSRNGTIDLVGESQMTRGDDKTTAETITYHVLEQRYEASGGDGPGGRVKIVIPQASIPGAPAPAANGAQPAAPAGGLNPAPSAPAAEGPTLQQPIPQATAKPSPPKP